jgi:Protein of unknown function (DUF2009)
VLSAGGALAMLSDPLIAAATAEIESSGRQRSAVATDIRRKEKAQEALSQRYSKGSELSAEQLLDCLYSIADNANYLRFNRDPVEKTIAFLHRWFEPRAPEDRTFSLAISVGQGGARLTHSHERQYTFVLQSLTLWREVHHNMFKLWTLAEEDLLREGNWYRLSDTGQGLNRVQQAPSLSRAVHAVLAKCQAKLGSWVGSSVVHLGDHNVPSALMFIECVPRLALTCVCSLLPAASTPRCRASWARSCW